VRLAGKEFNPDAELAGFSRAMQARGVMPEESNALTSTLAYYKDNPLVFTELKKRASGNPNFQALHQAVPDVMSKGIYTDRERAAIPPALTNEHPDLAVWGLEQLRKARHPHFGKAVLDSARQHLQHPVTPEALQAAEQAASQAHDSISGDTHRHDTRTFHDELLRIKDFLSQSGMIRNPNIYGMSFEELKAKSDEWHATLHKEKKQDGELEAYDPDGYEIVYTWNDGPHAGWHVKKLTSAENLVSEGENMGHCVGGEDYQEAVENGNSEIYSLQTPLHEPKVTWEIDVSSGQPYLSQVYGRGDSIPHFKYQSMVREFFGSNPTFNKISGSLSTNRYLPPAQLAQFPDYILKDPYLALSEISKTKTIDPRVWEHYRGDLQTLVKVAETARYVPDELAQMLLTEFASNPASLDKFKHVILYMTAPQIKALEALVLRQGNPDIAATYLHSFGDVTRNALAPIIELASHSNEFDKVVKEHGKHYPEIIRPHVMNGGFMPAHTFATLDRTGKHQDDELMTHLKSEALKDPAHALEFISNYHNHATPEHYKLAKQQLQTPEEKIKLFLHAPKEMVLADHDLQNYILGHINEKGEFVDGGTKIEARYILPRLPADALRLMLPVVSNAVYEYMTGGQGTYSQMSTLPADILLEPSVLTAIKEGDRKRPNYSSDAYVNPFIEKIAPVNPEVAYDLYSGIRGSNTNARQTIAFHAPIDFVKQHPELMQNSVGEPMMHTDYARANPDRAQELYELFPETAAQYVNAFKEKLPIETIEAIYDRTSNFSTKWRILGQLPQNVVEKMALERGPEDISIALNVISQPSEQFVAESIKLAQTNYPVALALMKKFRWHMKDRAISENLAQHWHDHAIKSPWNAFLYMKNAPKPEKDLAMAIVARNAVKEPYDAFEFVQLAPKEAITDNILEIAIEYAENTGRATSIWGKVPPHIRDKHPKLIARYNEEQEREAMYDYD